MIACYWKGKIKRNLNGVKVMQGINQVLDENQTKTKLFKQERLGETSCPDCGHTYEVLKTVVPDRDQGTKEIITDECWPCKKAAEEAAIVQGIEKRNKQQKQKNLQAVFDRFSLINPDLKGASLENYENRSEMAASAFEMANKYINLFDPEDPKNLLYYGSYGVGKSHLAKSICDAVIEKGHTAIFVNIPKLLKAFKSTYNKDSELTEDEIFYHLENADLLVLDDLGTGKMTEWAVDDIIFPLLDARQGMNTVFTTNLNPDDEELEEKIGGRNLSRAMSNANVIRMFGQDNRQ